jgi:hypothetical protein
MFHDFHQTWTVQIKTVLNTGLLPKGLTALVEQKAKDCQQWQPDVLAIESNRSREAQIDDGGGLIVLDPPTTELVFRTDEQLYSDRANRVVIKHHMGKTVAVVELVSPGNKSSQHRINDFVQNVVDFIQSGVHILIVDLFPPTSRDPQGVHQLIWNELNDEQINLPADRNLVLAAYEAGAETVAYVQPVAVGLTLPIMPLFLASGKHIRLPLEKSYQMAWATCSEEFRTIVESGVLPDFNDDE